MLNSLRLNAAITHSTPNTPKSYYPPPGSKTLNCSFAKPAPEVVAAANSPFVVFAPVRKKTKL